MAVKWGCLNLQPRQSKPNIHFWPTSWHFWSIWQISSTWQWCFASWWGQSNIHLFITKWWMGWNKHIGWNFYWLSTFWKKSNCQYQRRWDLFFPFPRLHSRRAEQYHQTSGAGFNGGDEVSLSAYLSYLFEHLYRSVRWFLVFPLRFIPTWLRHEKSEQSQLSASNRMTCF